MFRAYYHAAKDSGVKYYWTNGGWSSRAIDAYLMAEAAAATFASNVGECGYEKVPPLVWRVRVKLFILIQNDRVIDRAIKPSFLRTKQLDAYAGFKIAIGRIKQDGARSIAGVVADVGPLSGAKTWRISSEADGIYRLVGATRCPAELVVNRLSGMHRNGKFNDLDSLPMRVVLTTFGPTTPLSVEDVAVDSRQNSRARC